MCCGYWDNSIRCYSSEEGRLLQSVRVHKDIVTCIEVGSDGRTLASGVRTPLVPALWFRHSLLIVLLTLSSAISLTVAMRSSRERRQLLLMQPSTQVLRLAAAFSLWHG